MAVTAEKLRELSNFNVIKPIRTCRRKPGKKTPFFSFFFLRNLYPHIYQYWTGLVNFGSKCRCIFLLCYLCVVSDLGTSPLLVLGGSTRQFVVRLVYRTDSKCGRIDGCIHVYMMENNLCNATSTLVGLADCTAFCMLYLLYHFLFPSLDLVLSLAPSFSFSTLQYYQPRCGICSLEEASRRIRSAASSCCRSTETLPPTYCSALSGHRQNKKAVYAPLVLVVWIFFAHGERFWRDP